MQPPSGCKSQVPLHDYGRIVILVAACIFELFIADFRT
jgi:hypothetical protein